MGVDVNQMTLEELQQAYKHAREAVVAASIRAEKWKRSAKKLKTQVDHYVAEIEELGRELTKYRESDNV